MKDLVLGFFESQECESVANTVLISVVIYLFALILTGIFAANLLESAITSLFVWVVIANVMNAIFMGFEYAHSVDMAVQGLKSVPVERISKYHPSIISIAEGGIKYNEETELYEYEGNSFQSLVMALEVAMYNHPIYKDWDAYAIHSVARFVVKRYFPDHA